MLFDSLSGGSRLEIKFDREAMRELVELTPPGIDEIAALSAVSDLLVERAGLEQYRRTLKQACSERPELHFLTSGPWHPYSFVNIELEFKTQLGVS